MKTITQKLGLFALLGMSHLLYAANLSKLPYAQVDYTIDLTISKRSSLMHGYTRYYINDSKDRELLAFLISCFLYGNPLQYKNKPLPNDLSGQNLRGFDFTGCDFTYTNLAYTNLANVILARTTCNYQKAFQDNIKENKIYGDAWYQDNLPNDLKSITAVYPKLKNNTHKAKLLAIAAGLAWLPFYTGTEFYIKVAYWSCALLQLKQALGKPYGNQLVCSLEKALNYDANNYCWTTNYPQDNVNIGTKAPHANFETYLKDFTNGLKQYQCKLKDGDCYKAQIIKIIGGVKKAYNKIKDKHLRQECCNIAHALSKSYQIQQWVLLHHYLFFQHRLMWLKKSLGVGVGYELYYGTVRETRILRDMVGVGVVNEVQHSNDDENKYDSAEFHNLRKS